VSVTAPPRAFAASTEALRFHRHLVSSEHPMPAGLGARRVGRGTGALPALLLAPERDVIDGWASDAPHAEQRHGCIRYATDGQWLHGVAEVDDRGIGLRAAAERAYRDLFELLATGPCAHPLRLWNYMSRINDEAFGTERYRQFNAGRQQAFIEAGRSAFEGAPAACALGLREGPLQVGVLAGRVAPLALENPRQISAYRYPAEYGAQTPSFSRAALVAIGGARQVLFISGTASIVGHATMHVGDVRGQTEESLRNVATLRSVAAERSGQCFDADVLNYTLYLRHAADLPLVRAVFEREVGVASAAAREAIYLQADICRADLLVEIEAHGFTPPSTDA
jgi:chorismate lyase / 3-hydroxybenzoate synthase